MKESDSVVFFDGVCTLCNSSIDYIIKHDQAHVFKFSSLQSNFAKSTLNIKDQTNFDSFILLHKGNKYEKSTAALLVAKELNSMVKLLYVFMIIPKPIRDSIYSLIAKNRYNWFGKKETCRIPSPEERELFIK